MDEQMNKSMQERMEEQPETAYFDIFLYDNRSVSYRDPREGFLFIARAPRIIRPAADTGVRYSFNETNQELEVGLDTVPNRPEYERNSIRLKTGHKLCQACLDAFNYYCSYQDSLAAVRNLFEAFVFVYG